MTENQRAPAGEGRGGWGQGEEAEGTGGKRKEQGLTWTLAPETALIRLFSSLLLFLLPLV